MNLFKKLIGRNDVFFDLLEEGAEEARVSVDLFARFLGQLDEGKQPAGLDDFIQARRKEKRIRHLMIEALTRTFVTPFDREDIYRLASRLDDVMDFLEAAGDLVVLYDLEFLPLEMHEMTEILVRGAELTAGAMPRLKSLTNLSDYWIEINRLEDDADRLYRRFVARLFAGEYEALTVMKLKEVAEQLEGAADALENVANTVETIAVKES
jgi:hypothetical protein